MKMKPSEYFQRNCYISYDPDEQLLEPTARIIGSDRIIWGSDFPHPDAFYPGILDILRSSLANMSEKDQENIIARNAQRFYKLELPAIS